MGNNSSSANPDNYGAHHAEISVNHKEKYPLDDAIKLGSIVAEYLEDMYDDTEHSRNILMYNDDDVAVAPSPLHGSGVFATKDIPEHTLVTCFPATNGVALLTTDGSHIKIKEKDIAFPKYMRTSTHTNPAGIVLEANPQVPPKPGWCGHLVNDAAQPLCGPECTMHSVAEYLLRTTQHANCHQVSFSGGVVGIATSRAVERGEELLTTYGIGHDLAFKKYVENYVPSNQADVKMLMMVMHLENTWRQKVTNLMLETISLNKKRTSLAKSSWEEYSAACYDKIDNGGRMSQYTKRREKGTIFIYKK